MMKRYSRLGFLLGILFFVTGIQPIWADTTPISIEIGQGSGGGYSYSGSIAILVEWMGVGE